MLTVEANFSISHITCLWICVSESVCVQASSLCAYFCFYEMSGRARALDMRRNLSGASPCKHFCYYSTPALITLCLLCCALWPHLTALASYETLSLSLSLSLPDAVIEETGWQQKPPAESEVNLAFPALW